MGIWGQLQAPQTSGVHGVGWTPPGHRISGLVGSNHSCQKVKQSIHSIPSAHWVLAEFATVRVRSGRRWPPYRGHYPRLLGSLAFCTRKWPKHMVFILDSQKTPVTVTKSGGRIFLGEQEMPLGGLQTQRNNSNSCWLSFILFNYVQQKVPVKCGHDFNAFIMFANLPI